MASASPQSTARADEAPRHDPGGAGDVPPDLARRRARAWWRVVTMRFSSTRKASMGPAVVTVPSSATRRAHIPAASTRARPRSGPAISAALACTSPQAAAPATTVTAASPLSAGRPVAGSMRWWAGARTGGPPALDARAGGDGATGEAQQGQVAARLVRDRRRRSTQSSPPPTVRPPTRTSPPRSTHAPTAPAERRWSITRSADRPLPMPPRSMWHPGGSTTSPMRSSTSMPAGPGTSGAVPEPERGDGVPVTPMSSKVRS